DCCAALDSQALATAWNQKVDGDAWIANYIAQAVDSIVAIAVGDHHRGVINNAYEAREVAAWRAIDAIRTDSCKRQVCGRTNKSLIWRDEWFRSIRKRGPDRGIIKRFQRGDAGDYVFRC